jgi:integrase/recombinase XerD
MNRGSPVLSISKSIDGFLKFKIAEGLSARTLVGYEHVLKRWLEFIGDRPMSVVTSTDLTDYIAWLRTEYKPVRFNKSEAPLSAKSVQGQASTGV